MDGRRKIERDQIYTVCEAAVLIGVSDNVIYKEINSNKLKSKRVGNARGVHRILGEWLLEYLNK